ncbi:F-box protein PP2-A12-like [Cucurbita moschata]|uniref:F-box protein PP2-A12-like n=1 Tax=Cucurbita moschata TaxID=3662 RepID=A0A6J1FLI7_CUCMO|nr:F-box protein PP2-A12-like [Cucurbita moschata]XP_022941117.1 F-box protein PP2-A12-like [Cucurbita moschata]
MGVNFSAFFRLHNGSHPPSPPPPPPYPCLGDLSESCVAAVMEYLSPVEICKLARLNQAFRAASWADCVWESKLPLNYRFLVRRVIGDFAPIMSKREIYTRLCHQNPLDGGNKKFWLDKYSGGVCLSISSMDLRITGIDDRRYWNRISTEESRFNIVAYLQQTWWLEVGGEVDFPLPPGTYSLYFRLQLGQTSWRFGRKIHNLEHVHGWNIKPTQFQLWTSDGQHAKTERYLNEAGKWTLHHAGNFHVDARNESIRIKFSMTQIDCTHTKGGLCLDSVLICPVGYDQRSKCR